MRKPTTIERMYLDFDGFFASVEQQARPALRGRPVGVIPFRSDSDRTIVIACSREAKVQGVKSIMPVPDARRVCPDIVFVPQTPDLYRRAHNALLAEIEAVIPVDAVKSIDELTCRVEAKDQKNPRALGVRIKNRLRDNIGPHITCSIGFAANRQLAKMACKAGKWNTDRTVYGDGLTVWKPEDMPGPLLNIPLDDVPGIGSRLKGRLGLAGVVDMAHLLALQPKQMRALWKNVTGERLWYALHGYEIQTPSSERGMYGHGRVLPPEARTLKHAHSASRLLLVKAARRMRRDGYNASRVALFLALSGKGWGESQWLPEVHDDQAVLAALEGLWRTAKATLGRAWVIQVHVTLLDLTPLGTRQLDLFEGDDRTRQRWERATAAIDQINHHNAQTIVSLGPWAPPPGGFAGGKISYTRIPSAEDFW